jgi:23S rRNA pseudouridine2605 synthase
MTNAFFRLAPYIAARSVLSRRQAEQALLDGRITLNGIPITSFCFSQDQAHSLNQLALDGTVLDLPPAKVWMYHKPMGVIVTHYDPQGRLTFLEALGEHCPDGPLVSVGRLDLYSEGLLLLTNRPSIAHKLERSSWRRRYRVWINGMLSPEAMTWLEQGPTLDGIVYRPCSISIEQANAQGSCILLTLQEGKNREIRRLIGALDLKIQRLVRIAFGPFALRNLALGTLKDIPASFLKKEGLIS